MSHEINPEARAVLGRNLYRWDANRVAFRRECRADETTENWKAKAAVITIKQLQDHGLANLESRAGLADAAKRAAMDWLEKLIRSQS
jgi:hypothetical protein